MTTTTVLPPLATAPVVLLNADEFVRRYERPVRVAVRVRLARSSLRRHFDSMDVCQSVLVSFLRRVETTAVRVETPVVDALAGSL